MTLGRECLQRGRCRMSPTPHSLDYVKRIESPNGIEMCEDISDTEPLVQGEKEWLLLKDFSSASSFPGPKASSTSSSAKMDPADHAEYAAYERSISCADENIGDALALLLHKEDLFMELLYKKCFKVDRPQLQRCIDSHKKWLGHVQL